MNSCVPFLLATWKLLEAGNLLPERALDVDLIEGSLAIKLPTRWTNEKAEVGRVREEKKRREKIGEEKGPGARCRCAKR